MSSELLLIADIAQYTRHSACLKGANHGSIFSLDHLVGEQKEVFRPMRWSKLATSFWCDGLVRERLDRRRTAKVAADVTAAMAIG
jgi:hypothetical protein